MIETLKLACKVCEHGAAIERYRHLVFDNAQVRAFNGVVTIQASVPIDQEEFFAVNEERLARALAACDGEKLFVQSTKDFLIFKQKRLTIRVRKLSADAVCTPRLTLPAARERRGAGTLLEALRRANPFVSADASRPWSVSALVKDGFVYATNNLSIVRASHDATVPELRIPAPALLLLTELPALEWVAKVKNLIYAGFAESVLMFPETAGEWPDCGKFFAEQPAELPLLDEELLTGAKTCEKFADRFITLNDNSVEGKTATIESEYEVQVKKGRGTYSARLLSLILTHATHADFSTYPKPIFFAAEGIEGCAVGVREEAGRA